MRKVIGTYFFPSVFAPVYLIEGGDIMYPYRLNGQTCWATESEIRAKVSLSHEIERFEQLFNEAKQSIA